MGCAVIAINIGQPGQLSEVMAGCAAIVTSLEQSEQSRLVINGKQGTLTIPQKDKITISSALADANQIYTLGWLKSKADKLLIDLAYNGLKLGLKVIDAQIPKTKQAKLLLVLQKQRIALISGVLDGVNQLISRTLSKNLLSQAGYDIIKANNNYLKNI